MQFIYRINASADLVYVDENWAGFLAENGSGRTVPDAFLGSCLWNHFSDASTINLYQALIARARRLDREVIVPFRCDAPDRRRYMQMHVRSVAAGEIEFCSVLLREEPRTAVALLNSRALRSQEMIRMCSWCKKIHVGDSWREVEEAIGILNLFEVPSLPRITHTICRDCAEEILRKIEAPG